MRNVVTEFYGSVLLQLVEKSKISRSDSVLIVCGGPLDEKVFATSGFTDVTVTNLDDAMSNTYQDVENLTYSDGSFDIVVVHAGLHHCKSPHRGLLEMYRVARKFVLVFEARDSLMIRTAVRLGLTELFEEHSVRMSGGTSGGVCNGPVPNHIYRWTEADVTKTIASYDPAHTPTIDYFYEMRVPVQRFTQARNVALRAIAVAVEPLSSIWTKLLPKQCNEFAFAIQKAARLQPWMETPTQMRM